VKSNGESNVSEGDDLEGDDSDAGRSLAHLRRQLAVLTSNEVSTWRCLTSLKAAAQSQSVPSIPERVKKWMTQTSCESNRGRSCRGGGGKRRLAGILGSMIYQGLAERANEWHAELTEKELLESMDSSKVLNVIDTSEISKHPKSSKKRKKKKGANGTSSQRTSIEVREPHVEELHDETVGVDPEQDSDDEPGESNEKTRSEVKNPAKQAPFIPNDQAGASDAAVVKVAEGLDEELQNDSKNGKNGKNGDAAIDANIPKKGRNIPPNSEKSKAKPPSVEMTVGELGQEESKPTTSPALQVVENTSVGVIDPSGFQSAEDFLVGRFQAIMAEEAGIPVVFL